MVTTRSARSQGAAEVNGTSTAEKTPTSSKSRARTASTPSSSSKPENHHHDSKQQHLGHQYEFFGPHGPALLVLALPIVVYGLFFGCNRSAGCLQLFPTLSLPVWPQSAQLYSTEATLVFLGWFFGLLALHLLVDGKRVQGVVLPDGSRLTYKLNAFTLFLITYGSCLYFGFYTRQLNLGWLADHYLELITASVGFSTLLAIYLYISSFKPGAMLSAHGATGWPWYDFWMGRELNPRIGPIDLKEFCELYPGIIGWAILNLAFAHKQMSETGSVSVAILLVNIFQLFYVVDALWNEAAILTTMDITTDGFGFMLTFGDLSWVPFVFTTSTRYLTDYPQALSLPVITGILAVKATGYYIFRGANGQKDTFRRNPNDPSVKHLKTLPTARGTKLIISGWWGMSRHINYFGDWIMGLAWCLPCGLSGLNSVIPYFYCIYFATLLAHRERRDDAACRAKYGRDWDRYCSLVPYRIIPYIY